MIFSWHHIHGKVGEILINQINLSYVTCVIKFRLCFKSNRISLCTLHRVLFSREELKKISYSKQFIWIRTKPVVTSTCHSNTFWKILVIVNRWEPFNLSLQVTTLLWATLTLIKCFSLVWKILPVFCETPGLRFIKKKTPKQSDKSFQSLVMIVREKILYITYMYNIKQLQFLLVSYSSGIF